MYFTIVSIREAALSRLGSTLHMTGKGMLVTSLRVPSVRTGRLHQSVLKLHRAATEFNYDLDLDPRELCEDYR